MRTLLLDQKYNLFESETTEICTVLYSPSVMVYQGVASDVRENKISKTANKNPALDGQLTDRPIHVPGMVGAEEISPTNNCLFFCTSKYVCIYAIF